MTKNPFYNALAALGYISIVSSVMFYIEHSNTKPDNSPIAPVAFLSLLTLSAATMGYIFISQPVQMYLDGKKKAAVKLLVQTIGVFAGITAIAFILLLSRVFG